MNLLDQVARTLLLAAVALSPIAGCSGGKSGSSSDPVLCDATAPACADEQIQSIFHATATNGDFSNAEASGVFTTDVDATAGGVYGTEGFLYGRFTSSGLTKVELTDEESLDDMDWEIAFRRYLIRVNSGDSGPSCVKTLEVAGAFESISAAPATGYQAEDYFDAGCAIVEDGSGLPGTPATGLSSFWTYPSGCVAMTGQVFVLALGTGRHVKLEVVHYYATGQATCDMSGTPGSGSGEVQVRWAFLD